jgi:hypothetical protein
MTTLEALALAQDTIRIALKTAGYKNVDNMDQFERASALLNMAQEYIAIKPYAKAAYLTDYVKDTHKVESVAWAKGRGYN